MLMALPGSVARVIIQDRSRRPTSRLEPISDPLGQLYRLRRHPRYARPPRRSKTPTTRVSYDTPSKTQPAELFRTRAPRHLPLKSSIRRSHPQERLRRHLPPTALAHLLPVRRAARPPPPHPRPDKRCPSLGSAVDHRPTCRLDERAWRAGGRLGRGRGAVRVAGHGERAGGGQRRLQGKRGTEPEQEVIENEGGREA